MIRKIESSTQGWHDAVVSRVHSGARFAGMFGDAKDGEPHLIALVDAEGRFDAIDVEVAEHEGQLRYPSLTPEIDSAFWYERAAHDLSGLVPVGHPRLDPLLLSIEQGSNRPQPGVNHTDFDVTSHPDTQGPVDLTGHGLFTLPLGPVRSGVFESIEFLIETPGEDIPHLNLRPHFKHRGVAKRFEGHTPADGVLVAERVEGVASIAHALAFSHASETAAGIIVPPRAQFFRVILAELERIANHLEAAMRLADAASLAVATSRFGWHKETTMRIMSRLTGSRFGRSAIIPGGVRADVAPVDGPLLDELELLHHRIDGDAARAMRTPSFLDRLRGTGPLDSEYAARWGLLGPIGRASGQRLDTRWDHPYDGYPRLHLPDVPAVDLDCDTRARLRVRWREIEVAFDLIRQAAAAFAEETNASLAVDDGWRPADGLWIGVAEAPQGEALHAVAFHNGVVTRCFARSASLHNLVAFHDAFRTDVFTDFAFIEAGFGLSYAGVAM